MNSTARLTWGVGYTIVVAAADGPRAEAAFAGAKVIGRVVARGTDDEIVRIDAA